MPFPNQLCRFPKTAQLMKSAMPKSKISRAISQADVKKTRFLYGKSAVPSAAPRNGRHP
jgi:hypothetical protein